MYSCSLHIPKDLAFSHPVTQFESLIALIITLQKDLKDLEVKRKKIKAFQLKNQMYKKTVQECKEK